MHEEMVQNKSSCVEIRKECVECSENTLQTLYTGGGQLTNCQTYEQKILIYLQRRTAERWC